MFVRGPKYIEVKSRLTKARNDGREAVLNIHIPGTGGLEDSQYPTRVAYSELFEHLEAQALPLPAFISFDGVGSKGDNVVPTVLRKTNTLEIEEISTAEKAKHLLNLINIVGNPSNTVDYGALNHTTAFVAGIAKGAGMSVINDIIINTLKALEEDACLPDMVFLSGHSRGSINAISAACRIYIQFGNNIKSNLCLTDPVAGPGRAEDRHALDSVIPPNVQSVTILYAPLVGEKLLIAKDFSRLIVTNPDTVVTAYPVPNTNHASICQQWGYWCEVNLRKKSFFGIETKTEFLSLSSFASYQMTFAANNVDLPSTIHKDKTQFDPTQISGVGARAGSIYYKTTPITDGCSPLLQAAHDKIRNTFDVNYQTKPVLAISSGYFDGLVKPEHREKFIIGMFVDKKENAKHLDSLSIFSQPGQRDKMHDLSYRKIKAIQEVIFQEAQLQPSQDCCHKIIKLDANKQPIERYVSATDKEKLDLIQNTIEVTSRDPLNPRWSALLESIEKMNIAVAVTIKKS